MNEEWTVAIVNAHPLGSEQTAPTRDMVAIGSIGEIPDSAWLTLCDDEGEAARVADAVAAQHGLPLYDGADPFPAYVNASTYVDVDADGPDPYHAQRNRHCLDCGKVIAQDSDSGWCPECDAEHEREASL